MKLAIIKDGIEQEIEASILLRKFILSDSRQLHLTEAGYDITLQFISWLSENQYEINRRIYSDPLTIEFYKTLDEYHREKND